MLEDVTMRENSIEQDEIVKTGSDYSIPASSINRFFSKFFAIAKYACIIISVIFAILAVKSFINKDTEKPKKHIIKGTIYTLGAIGAFCAGYVLFIVKCV